MKMKIRELKEWLNEATNKDDDFAVNDESEVVVHCRISGTLNKATFTMGRVNEWQEPNKGCIRVVLDQYCDYEKGIVALDC
jgi:hypothetical protein